MKSGKYMESERIRLRPWQASDTDILFEYARDPRIGRSCGWPPHRNRGESERCIREIFSAPETYAVVLKDTDMPVGNIALKTPDAACGEAGNASMEMGFWIGAPCWGRGYVEEAAELLLEHAFEELQLESVWCGYYAGNEKSRRAQEKIGFIPNHIAVNAVTTLGEYTDTYYSRLNVAEWLELQLNKLSDTGYKNFQSKLIPNIDTDTMLGVRIPELRSLARKLSCDSPFLRMLPHRLYEENMLHAIIISRIKDQKRCFAEIERFLPFVNNWAVCDAILPKCFAGDKELLDRAHRLVMSEAPYTARFGFGLLMRHFTGDLFRAHHMKWVNKAPSKDYYVKMGAAWYLAEAMVLYFEDVRYFLEYECDDREIARMAIRKGIESFRVSQEDKEQLKHLKISR